MALAGGLGEPPGRFLFVHPHPFTEIVAQGALELGVRAARRARGRRCGGQHLFGRCRCLVPAATGHRLAAPALLPGCDLFLLGFRRGGSGPFSPVEPSRRFFAPPLFAGNGLLLAPGPLFRLDLCSGRDPFRPAHRWFRGAGSLAVPGAHGRLFRHSRFALCPLVHAGLALGRAPLGGGAFLCWGDGHGLFAGCGFAHRRGRGLGRLFLCRGNGRFGRPLCITGRRCFGRPLFVAGGRRGRLRADQGQGAEEHHEHAPPAGCCPRPHLPHSAADSDPMPHTLRPHRPPASSGSFFR